MKICLLACLIAVCSGYAFASESLIDEPDGNSYHFVTHYSIKIDAPAAKVWEHLIDLRSWMYDFEMKPISGFDQLEGQVLRLYEEQNYYVQVTKAIPGKLLVIANLPVSMEGEQLASGTSVTTLTQSGTATTVALTMSRRYTWDGPGENPVRSRRLSNDFVKNSRATWNGFLAKLRELATNERTNSGAFGGT